PAVDNINLDIASGEFMTLLGPSGSGKTTTLNMIAGFIRPTSGRVELDGRDVSRLPPHRRGLGMVFQHYALFPHLSVAENVAFPLRRRRVPAPEIRRRVADVLALVGLTGYEHRRPNALSGGQQQRVALARAVVFNPPVLLMDEPLSALDKNLRERLRDEIAAMHRELGITFVFVTHDQEEALALSDRIAVFHKGAIEQVGTPQDLYRAPASLFVARFLGNSNVFQGRIRRTGEGTLLEGDGFVIRVPEQALEPNGSGAVVVRPENVTLAPDGSSPEPETNALGATVTDIVYQGAYQLIKFDTDCGVRGAARAAPGMLPHVRVGGRVMAHWPVERSVLIPQNGIRGDHDEQ